MRSVFIISLSTIPTQLQSYILLLGPGILLRHIRLALTTMEATVSVKTPITLHRPFSRSPVRYRVLLDACKLIKYLVFISGVAIYYMSPLWPYAVDSAISVDTGPQEIVDLMDHSRPVQNGGEETVQSQVVWGRSGLTNGTHTVVVSLHSNYIVVDAFMYVCLVFHFHSIGSHGLSTCTVIPLMMQTICPRPRRHRRRHPVYRRSHLPLIVQWQALLPLLQVRLPIHTHRPIRRIIL